MKETIAEMLKVEAQGKDILSAARKEADELLQKARAEAMALEEKAQAEAKAEADLLHKNGIQQARVERQQALAQMDKDHERLKQVPDAKSAAAEQVILSSVAGIGR